jgi:regulator of sirC expression with transglutaminase-like and TPR domain
MEWKAMTPRKALRPMEHDLQEPQDAQDEIGWDKFMFGNISVLWQEIQAQYFQEIGKQNSGLRWTSALIQKIWQVAWDQWEHRNAILYNSENLVTQAESVMIASWVQMELENEIQGLLQGDRYLFDDHRVAKSVEWTVDSQLSWLQTVSEARHAYNVSLTRLQGIFEGRS